MSLPSYPSTSRNKVYIVDILRRYVPKTGVMLETASGTGEHICFFCKEFPGLIWQPSDKSSELFWAIRERTCAENNVQKPILIDLTMKDCQISFENFTAVVNINMIHIAPWEACIGLFELAEISTKKDGFVYIYGPFKIGGVHTSKSNEKFDESLRERNPDWGVRDLEAVDKVARSFGFYCVRQYDMPVNNKSIIFKRM